MSVWWWPTPAPGELVPDYPPTDLTGYVTSVEIELGPDAATWTAQCQHPETVDITRISDAGRIKRCIDCGVRWTEER